ncbi:Lamassu anti-phage system protein LmuB [Brevibacillus laterosporus]|uniref:Lamassu anti-phage system protein LmuB n=1 Tax=Brevibacillus laterosporus TaxID=1465 RepID=UPI0035A58D65
MNRVLINKLFIFDVIDKKSKSVIFKDGINIVTSKGNQIGKSTIMKSIYYTLGAVVFFAERLNLKTKIHILEIEVNGKEYVFIRHGDIVVIKDNKGILKTSSSTELSCELGDIFGFSIFLEDKQKRNVIAPPVFHYIPYYIDQDHGWTSELKSFDNLGQFDKKSRDSLYYYHLGILDVEYGLRLKEKKELDFLLDSLKTRNKEILGLLTYIRENITAINLEMDTTALQIQKREILSKYKKYSYDLNNIRRKIIEYQEELHKIENVIGNLNNALKQSDKVKEHIKHQFDVECPHCFEHFELQTKDILKINYKIADLEASKLEMIDIKEKILKQIKKVQKEFQDYEFALKAIEKEKIDSDNTFEDILKFKGLQETQKQLIIELKKNVSEIEINSEKLKKVIGKLKKWQDEIDKANKRYRDILSLNLKRFNSDENELPKNYNIGKNVKASGSGQVRLNLSRVYSFIKLVEEYKPDGLKYPLVIDSPKGGEQSISNSELILKLLTKEAQISNQIILATIDFESFYVGNTDKFNIITLNNEIYSLLSVEDYQRNKIIIDYYISIYFEANS